MTPIGNRTTGLATLAAPVLMVVSTLAYLAGGDGLSEGEVPGTIQIWASVAFGVASVGLARLLEGSAPRAAALLTVLGTLGAVGNAAYGMDAIQVAFFDTAEGVGESGVGPLALRIPGLAFPLTLLLLGVLLARHRRVPAPAGYGLALGALLLAPSRIGDIAPLALVADVVVLAALGTIGLGLLGARRVGSNTARPVGALAG